MADSDDTIQFERFDVTGPNPLGSRATARVLAPYLEASDLAGLEAAAAALQSELHARGYAFYTVFLSPQTLDGETVRLQVEAIALESVDVEGNEHYTDATVLRSLPALRPGRSPNVRALARDVDVANLHPGRQTHVTFSAGETVATRVSVADQRPLQGFAWVNNTGSEQTGQTRVGAGFQHANLFARDHTLTASYTTASRRPSDVSQYAASYRIPLYRLSSELDLFGVHSDTDAGTVADFFEVRGRGTIVGARFTRHLARKGTYRHSVALGIEDKAFDNDVRFDGVPIGTAVRSRPWTVGYRGDVRGERTVLSFNVDHQANLSGGRNNTDEAYAASRVGADSRWRLYRAGANVRHTLSSGWELAGRVDGQYTNDPLVSGEQFGVGGMDSVRGLNERALADDKGLRMGLEVWTPPLKSARLVAFIDRGQLQRVDPLPDEVSRDSVTTAGLGLRWTGSGRFTLRLDYGRVLSASDAARPDALEKGDSRVHVSGVIRF